METCSSAGRHGEGVTNPLEHMVEDRISALLTKDPNKLSIYLEGLDGHSLRAYTYFKDQMPDIEAQLNQIRPNQRYFKITDDQGKTEYVTADHPIIQNSGKITT